MPGEGRAKGGSALPSEEITVIITEEAGGNLLPAFLFAREGVSA